MTTRTKIDPAAVYVVTAGFVVDLPSTPWWAPRVGTVWPASHEGIAFWLANDGERKGFVARADATEPELDAARQRAATVVYREPAPDPHSPVDKPVQLVKSTRYIVVNGLQVASPEEVFDASSWIAQAIDKEYPGALEPVA